MAKRVPKKDTPQAPEKGFVDASDDLLMDMERDPDPDDPYLTFDADTGEFLSDTPSED